MVAGKVDLHGSRAHSRLRVEDEQRTLYARVMLPSRGPSRELEAETTVNVVESLCVY